MSTAGVVPGPVTRAAVVVSVMAVLGGLTRMVVSGWAARDLWGFVVDSEPACLVRGSCTSDDLETLRDEAWHALVPGAVLAVAGLALACIVAGVALYRRPWVTRARVVRRDREPRPVRVGPARLRHSPWGRVAVVAGAVSLAVGILTALPVLVASLVSPPVAAAFAACGVAAVVLVLTLVGRVNAPMPDAVLSAVHAAFLACVTVGACLWVTAAGDTSYGVLVVLLVLVPPAATGLATALGLRALARIRRRRVRRLKVARGLPA